MLVAYAATFVVLLVATDALTGSHICSSKVRSVLHAVGIIKRTYEQICTYM